MGDVRALNVWLSLSRCGDLAPGLDLVPKRVDYLVEAGTDGAPLSYVISPAKVEEVAGRGGHRPADLRARRRPAVRRPVPPSDGLRRLDAESALRDRELVLRRLGLPAGLRADSGVTTGPGPEPAGSGDAGLWFEVDPLPETLPARREDAVFVFGACFHPHREVVGLEILVDGLACEVSDFGLPRLDVFRRLHPEPRRRRSADPAGRPGLARGPGGPVLSQRLLGDRPDSRSRAGRRPSTLELRAALEGGRPGSRRGRRGSRRAEPTLAAARPLPLRPREARIAIAMATFNPDLDLFRAQVGSLREQTDTNWICVVNDDCSRPELLPGDRRRARGRRSLRARSLRAPARLLPELRARARAWCPRTPASSRSAIRTTAGTRTSWRPCGGRSAAPSSSTAISGSSTPRGRCSPTPTGPAVATTTPTCCRC